MKDWLKRALKTFVQSFMGTIVAEAGAVATNVADWTDLKAVGAAFAPIVIAALAAAISAVWNIILESWRLKSE